MSLLSDLKSFLSDEEVRDPRDENPNFITHPSRIKHMIQVLTEAHVQASVVLSNDDEFTSRILDVSRSDLLLDQLNSRVGHKQMTKGTAIQIKAKHNSVPFNFDAVIIGYSTDGGYIISIPDKIYHPQKRAFFRVPLSNIEKHKFTGAIQYSENNVTGYIYDVSFGGICVAVYSNTYVKKGVILSPTSMTLKDNTTIHADVTVCSVKKSPLEGFTRIGCEFLDIERNEKRSLHKFITECERERAKK
jgi:c-di-GMP-binding flagellar brake protein YcgR